MGRRAVPFSSPVTVAAVVSLILHLFRAPVPFRLQPMSVISIQRADSSSLFFLAVYGCSSPEGGCSKVYAYQCISYPSGTYVSCKYQGATSFSVSKYPVLFTIFTFSRLLDQSRQGFDMSMEGGPWLREAVEAGMVGELIHSFTREAMRDKWCMSRLCRMGVCPIKIRE